MARPLKQTVDYFPHMVFQGKTILILRNEFGNDGYAFWFSLLELLCKAEGQVYDYNNPASWRLLLAETHVKEDIATNILKTLAEVDAIDKDLHINKIIWSQNLVDNLEQVYDRRATGKPKKPGYCDGKLILKGVSVDNNSINVVTKPTSKQNKTKQNKTRQNKTIQLLPNNPEHEKLLIELCKLQGWSNSKLLQGQQNLIDYPWLEEFIKDYPGFSVTDIHDCRDYHLSKKTHNIRTWKTRLRNWMGHKRKPGELRQIVWGNNERKNGIPGNRPSGSLNDIDP